MFLSYVIQKTLIFFIGIRNQKIEKHFEKLILKALTNKIEKIKTLPWYLKSPKRLMHLIFSFNPASQGRQWQELRKNLIDVFILPKARSWVKSLFWQKRLLLARALYLSLEKKDTALVSKLLDDRSFLVKSQASLYVKEHEDEKLIEKVLSLFSSSKGFAHLFFRDVCIKCFSTSFPLAEERLSKTKDKTTLINLLSLISTRPYVIKTKIIDYLIESEDPDIFYACVKVHAFNPQKNSEKILFEAFEHTSASIRQLACYGLKAFPGKSCVKHLKQALHDDAWPVQAEAALSLEFLGEEGIKSLNEIHNLHFENEDEITSLLLEKRVSYD